MSENLLLDEEYLALEPDHQHVWLVVIISRIGGKCGIFKRGYGVIAQQSGRPLETVRDAFAEFVRLGWVIADETHYWIRSRIKHRGHNVKWRGGALDEASELTRVTPLAQQCIDYYDVYYSTSGSRTRAPAKRGSVTKRGPVADISPTDRGPIADTSRGAIKAKQSKAKHTKQPALELGDDLKYSPAELKLATRMDGDIQRLKDGGYAVQGSWRRRPEQVAVSLALSEIPTADIEAAWIWGLENQFWTPQLIKQASFCSSPARWGELVNQWRSKTHRRTGPAAVSNDYSEIDSGGQQ